MFSEASKAWSLSKIVSGFFPFSFEELSTEEIGSVSISTGGDTLFEVEDSCLFATGDLERSRWLNGIIETKNMWQQATITFAEDANFKGLKACYGLFVLNDIVRVHMCDQSHSDILARSKFSAKLAGLPRFRTGKQLKEIRRMVYAIAWVIPKA
ncbi:6297_t:CDS:2, partial [Funneliformis geosporum]